MIGLSSKANTDNFVFKILEKQKAASAQSKDNARQMEEMEQIIKISQEQLETLKKRKEEWQPKPMRYKRGALRIFSEHAVSPMKGAYLKFDD